MSNKERIKENKKLQKRLQGPYLEYYTKVHSNLKKSITSAHHRDMLHPMLTDLLQAQEKSMDVEQFMGQEASGYSALMLKNHSKTNGLVKDFNHDLRFFMRGTFIHE